MFTEDKSLTLSSSHILSGNPIVISWGGDIALNGQMRDTAEGVIYILQNTRTTETVSNGTIWTHSWLNASGTATYQHVFDGEGPATAQIHASSEKPDYLSKGIDLVSEYANKVIGMVWAIRYILPWQDRTLTDLRDAALKLSREYQLSVEDLIKTTDDPDTNILLACFAHDIHNIAGGTITKIILDWSRCCITQSDMLQKVQKTIDELKDMKKLYENLKEWWDISHNLNAQVLAGLRVLEGVKVDIINPNNVDLRLEKGSLLLAMILEVVRNGHKHGDEDLEVVFNLAQDRFHMQLTNGIPKTPKEEIYSGGTGSQLFRKASQRLGGQVNNMWPTKCGKRYTVCWSVPL